MVRLRLPRCPDAEVLRVDCGLVECGVAHALAGPKMASMAWLFAPHQVCPV